MKKYAALIIVILLSMAGCVMFISARPEDTLTGYGFLILAFMFLPIWLAQRKGD